MQFSTGFLRSLTLAAGIALVPMSASAVTLTISAQSSSSVFGSNGHSSATIVETTIRPTGVGTKAGGFAVQGNLHGTGVEQFTAWCLDIATSLKLPSTYTTTTTPFGLARLSLLQISNIERLFETGLKTLALNQNSQSAGFQLALWEVLYEKSGTFNMANGNFSASSSAAAIEKANLLLAGMSGPITQNYNMTFLQSTDNRSTVGGHYSQHLVTASAVPLPAGGALLLAGLGALAALRRRRAKTVA